MVANYKNLKMQSIDRATICGAFPVSLLAAASLWCATPEALAQTASNETHVRHSNQGMFFGKMDPAEANTPELRGEMTVTRPRPSYSELDESPRTGSRTKSANLTSTSQNSLAEPVSDQLPVPGRSALSKGARAKQHTELVESETEPNSPPLPDAELQKVGDQNAQEHHTAARVYHTTPVKTADKPKMTGRADYYADQFHGRKTASGQVHDKTKFTAAHRTLPFGTKLKIVNRSNGKSCVVVVNDRGPFTKDRMIDLSLAAAKELELITSKTRLVDCFLIED